MSGTLKDFDQLTDAEQYFEFFELPYDPETVKVNRLHILRKFSQLIQPVDRSALTEPVCLNLYKEALQGAYETFLVSSPLEQKLFKVFRDRHPGVVLLSDIEDEEEADAVTVAD